MLFKVLGDLFTNISRKLTYPAHVERSAAYLKFSTHDAWAHERLSRVPSIKEHEQSKTFDVYGQQLCRETTVR